MNGYLKRIICFSLAMICLLVASTLYILFRSKTLLFFHWANYLGFLPIIESIRVRYWYLTYILPEWIVYSFPFALWVISYSLFANGIWLNSKSNRRHLWIWCVPVIAVLSEVLQSMKLIPGRFDFIDFCLLSMCIPLSVYIYTQVNQRKVKHFEKQRKNQRIFFRIHASSVPNIGTRKQ